MDLIYSDMGEEVLEGHEVVVEPFLCDVDDPEAGMQVQMGNDDPLVCFCLTLS